MPATTIQLILEGQDQASAAIQKVNAEVAALGQTAVAVTAQTVPVVQPLEDLKKKAVATVSPLKTLGQTATATKQSMAALRNTLTLVGLQAFPQLTTGVMAGTSAMKAARSVALLAGVSLTTVSVAAGGVGLVLAAGYALWRNYTAGIREAQKSAADFKAGIASLPAALGLVNTSLKAGLLSSQGAAKFRDLLTGKTALFKNQSGEVTTSPTEKRLVQQQTFGPMGPGARLVEKEVALQRASLVEVQKWVAEQMVGLNISEEMVRAQADLRDQEAAVAAEAMGDYEAQRLAIQKKYQTEREEIQKNADVLKAAGQLSKQKEADASDAIARSNLNERVALYKLEVETLNKAAEAEKIRRDEAEKTTQKILDGLQQRRIAELADIKAIEDIRGQLHIDLLDGLAAEMAAIDKKYDDELDRLRELKASTEDLMLVEKARDKAKTDAKEKDALNQPTQADRFAESKGTIGMSLRDMIKPQKKLTELQERERARRIQGERDM